MFIAAKIFNKFKKKTFANIGKNGETKPLVRILTLVRFSESKRKKKVG